MRLLHTSLVSCASKFITQSVIDFVLEGYYSAGPDLTLVAVSPPLQRGGRPVVHDLAHANLRLRRDRIKNIRRLINLAGLFQTLADLVRAPEPEFEPIDRFLHSFYRSFTV